MVDDNGMCNRGLECFDEQCTLPHPIPRPEFNGYPLTKVQLDWIEQEVNAGDPAGDYYDHLMKHARHTLAPEFQQTLADAFTKTAEDVLNQFAAEGAKLQNFGSK